MTIILIVAAILAALMLFRTARALAAVALLVVLIYFDCRFETWKRLQSPHMLEEQAADAPRN